MLILYWKIWSNSLHVTWNMALKKCLLIKLIVLLNVYV